MKKSRLLGAVCASIFSLIAIPSHSALISKLGGDVVYDDNLNITLVADANLASTMDFDVTGISSGAMTWEKANEWIAAMNASDSGAGYLGYNDWILPSALNQDDSGPCSGADCTDSDMGHLFYTELSGTSGSSILGSGDTDLNLFSNIQISLGAGDATYWTSTTNASNTARAWNFSFADGEQSHNFKVNAGYVWAVRVGDVTAVPIPAAVWLFGSGLLGLVSMARRKKTA